MKKHNSKSKSINNNRAFFSHCFSNALKLSPMITMTQDNPHNQPREKKTQLCFSIHIHNAIHILWSSSLHNSHPQNNNATIAHTHPYISTSRTTTIHKLALNAIEIQSHNNNTIPHNLQETNQRKSKANCPQSLSPITINYQKFCCLLGGAAVVEAEGEKRAHLLASCGFCCRGSVELSQVAWLNCLLYERLSYPWGGASWCHHHLHCPPWKCGTHPQEQFPELPKHTYECTMYVLP